MAVVITADTLNQELTVNKSGGHATRTLIVSNITGSAADAVVYNAIFDATVIALPLYRGSVHPTMSALFCSEIRGKAIDVDKVEITATYEAFVSEFVANNTQQPRLTVSSFIQSQETNEDKSGNPLVVTHTGDADIVATVSIDTCLTNLSFSRLETAAPIAKQTFVDTLNSASVTWRGTTFAAKTLKCTSINGNAADDSGNYMVTYNFLYNPNGWQATVVYEKDGSVPGDVTAGNGIATYDVYPTSTFSSLNIS